jgi:spore germination cell wall hydrolase CwlJ-like protein
MAAKCCAGALSLAAVLFIGVAAVGASASYDGPNDLPLIMSDISQRDLYCMALAVYFEGGSTAESEDGQRHIARVVHERAKANQKQWGGSDICDVVFYRREGVCQFSFVCLPEGRRTPRTGAAWDYSMMIAREELEERSTLLERSIRYYMNSSRSSARSACWFRKELVKVVEAGRHEFFREPTAAELAELSAGVFPECMRFALELKSKKHAGTRKTTIKRLATLIKQKGKKMKFANC